MKKSVLVLALIFLSLSLYAKPKTMDATAKELANAFGKMGSSLSLSITPKTGYTYHVTGSSFTSLSRGALTKHHSTILKLKGKSTKSTPTQAK